MEKETVIHRILSVVIVASAYLFRAYLDLSLNTLEPSIVNIGFFICLSFICSISYNRNSYLLNFVGIFAVMISIINKNKIELYKKVVLIKYVKENFKKDSHG